MLSIELLKSVPFLPVLAEGLGIVFYLKQSVVRTPGKGLLVFDQQVTHRVVVVIDGFRLAGERGESVGVVLVAVGGEQAVIA
ncbi:MAG: hypothetical protein OEV64_07375 [Desulfobulbaceae bacterium]|nr:hypothetical protein [Desulfobulbaceae bacterium]